MIDQPDTAARILTAVEAALGDQLTTTAHVQALDHIRRILGDEPAPDAVAPSPKAPQSQDGENDRLRAELAELEQLREMYQQQSAANAAYRLQIDELIRRTSEYADRAITNGQRAEQAEAELATLRQVARGYCPACGRGDCAPTAEDWEAERQSAEHAENERDQLRAALRPLIAAADRTRNPSQLLGSGLPLWAAADQARDTLAALDQPKETQP